MTHPIPFIINHEKDETIDLEAHKRQIKLDKHMAAYLARGGTITQIPTGKTSYTIKTLKQHNTDTGKAMAKNREKHRKAINPSEIECKLCSEEQGKTINHDVSQFTKFRQNERGYLNSCKAQMQKADIARRSR